MLPEDLLILTVIILATIIMITGRLLSLTQTPLF